MINIKTQTFNGTYSFVPYYFNTGLCEMHYVSIGTGEPIVMVHGDPTWGYMFRSLISSLSDQYHCVVPDHMGMGKSGVPNKPYPYRLEHHIANLESLLLSLEISGITLILHDWGGPVVGLGFAIKHPTLIKRIVLMNTWAFAQWPGGDFPRLLEIIRSDRGEKFVLDKNGYVKPALLGTTYHSENLTETVLDAYEAPFSTTESRVALLCWTRDIPVTKTDESYSVFKNIELKLDCFTQTPVLLIWGMEDPVLTPRVLDMWQAVYPQAKTHKIDQASHFILEDAPKDIVNLIRIFLQENP